jgi:hypothetical protein
MKMEGCGACRIKSYRQKKIKTERKADNQKDREINKNIQGKRLRTDRE